MRHIRIAKASGCCKAVGIVFEMKHGNSRMIIKERCPHQMYRDMKQRREPRSCHCRMAKQSDLFLVLIKYAVHAVLFLTAGLLQRRIPKLSKGPSGNYIMNWEEGMKLSDFFRYTKPDA